MEFQGYLLDVDYITQNESPVIRLWCRDLQGRLWVLLDGNFEPYFYAIASQDSIQLIQNAVATRYGEKIRVKRLESLTRKEYGKPISVLKVVMHHPQHVPSMRELIKSLGIQVREADILFSVRYIIDKGLVPMDGIRAHGRQISLGYAPGLIVDHVEHIHLEDYPQLRILGFDCEIATDQGQPDPDKHPICMISISTPEGTQVLEASSNGDGELIQEFIQCIKSYDPDIIVGYNSDQFDWPYLRDRARKNRLRLDIGRDGSTASIERRGDRGSVRIPGRINIDLYKVVERDLGEIKIKRLEEVADYLGVISKSSRILLDPFQISEYWRDIQKRHLLREYASQDAQSTLGICQKLLPLQIEFSRILRQPLGEVVELSRGRQVEALLIAEAYKIGELVPNRAGVEETYTGGMVFEPKQGLHENVACLDFSSMYPNIMIAYNISPDTLTDDPNADCYISPEVSPGIRYRFLKHPDGFFRRILKQLVEMRKKIKLQMKSCSQTEFRILDIRQQCLKILSNAFYGYTGWGDARWYKRECAEATTAWGREILRAVKERAESLGAITVYGDSVPGDTPVIVRKNGIIEILPISEIFQAPNTNTKSRYAPRDLEIWTEQGWQQVKYVYRHKVRKKLYQIFTRKSMVEVTQDHSLVVDGSRISPTQLKLGDRLELIAYPQHQNEYQFDPKLAWVIGLFIAEGSSRKCRGYLKHQWKIDNSNLELLQRAARILESYGFPTKIITKSSKVHRLVPQSRIKPIQELFSHWCVNKQGSKRIPYFILYGTPQVQRAFLDGYLAGDGRTESQGNISITTTDKVVMAGICKILQDLGYDYSLSGRNDKPNAIRLRTLLNPKHSRLGSCDRIRGIREYWIHDYVYDVETQNHHFVGGIGNVLLHNTDSIFLKSQDQDIAELARKLSSQISAEFPLELELQDIYKTIFFVGKKKRYAGIRSSGEIVVRGLEVRRGDWCELAKELQDQVIKIILIQKDVKRAVDYVNEVISQVKSGKIPLEKFVVYKTLTRDLDEYVSHQMHVKAAQIAQQRFGIRYPRGSKVGYVIVKGSGGISDRAYPYEVFKRMGRELGLSLDLDHYIHHQLLPSVERLLGYFGYDSSRLISAKAQTSLEHWLS